LAALQFLSRRGRGVIVLILTSGTITWLIGRLQLSLSGASGLMFCLALALRLLTQYYSLMYYHWQLL
jgi:hypothetical protein